MNLPGALFSRPGGDLDRRIVLAGLAGSLVAAVGPAGSVRAAARATHDLQVGSYRVSVISDGTLSLPLSLALPNVQRRDLEALLTSEHLAQGFVAQTNVALVSGGGERILIDAGAGANFQASAGKLAANLEAASVDPDTITKVVLTHAHPDHLWGAVDEFDGAPRFPNAAFVISGAEWDFWLDPETLRRMPAGMQGMAAGSARILKLLEGKIERRRPGDAIAPGVTLVDTAGHTPGHVSVLLDSEGRRLLVGGDVLGHAEVSFQRPDWEWGTDVEPDRAAKARLSTLAKLASEETALLGFHLPWPGLGRVERAGPAFRFVPATL